jgi:thiopeptide-type bacteriocin biosynthesis protein
MSSTDWSSWHLHLGSDARTLADRVIDGVVKPVVATLDGAPWFFMRYWQGGPHLRFRVGDLDPRAYERVERELAARLAEAGRLEPGEQPISAAAYRKGAEVFAATERGADRTPQDFREPGVHRAVYEPEYARYGGAALMPRTEALFQLSSELVLALLPRLTTPAARTLMALRGTMSAAVALGDPAEQAAFYGRSMAAWREWAAGSGCTPEQLDQLCAAEPVDNPPDPGQHGPFAPWHAAIGELAADIRATTPVPPPMVVFSHVHMLNNRLGRSLFDELRGYAWLAAAFPAGDSPAEPLVPVGAFS